MFISVRKLLILTLVTLFMSSISMAGEIPFMSEDRDRLIRIEVKLEDMEKRFEQVDIRFTELREDMNKRFELMDKRFEQIISFTCILSAVFTAIAVTTIGFAVWDRRTMVRPFESAVKQIEEKIDNLDNKGTVKANAIIKVLREFAIMDIKMGDILKKFHL